MALQKRPVTGRARVGRFSSRAEADLARSLLRDHGIDSRLVADDVAGLQPELSLATGGLQLEVLAEDVEDARAVLDEVPAGGRLDPSSTPRRATAWLLLIAAVLLAVSTTAAIFEVGLRWL